MIRVLLILLCTAIPAKAERVIADLNQTNISITTSFDGSDLFIFGAVARTAPPPEGAGPLEVVVEVLGPSAPVTVRRKERRLGIWVNTESVEIDRAPHFVAIASTGDLEGVMSFTEMMRHQVDYSHHVFLEEEPEGVRFPQEFRRAVIRIREEEGLYRKLPGTVKLTDETLFSTQIDLPSNLVEGDYETRVFLVRDTEVIDRYSTTVAVRKAGLERFLFNLAHEQPLIYGLMSIFVALAAGWGAAQFFVWLRR